MMIITSPFTHVVTTIFLSQVSYLFVWSLKCIHTEVLCGYNKCINIYSRSDINSNNIYSHGAVTRAQTSAFVLNRRLYRFMYIKSAWFVSVRLTCRDKQTFYWHPSLHGLVPIRIESYQNTTTQKRPHTLTAVVIVIVNTKALL